MKSAMESVMKSVIENSYLQKTLQINATMDIELTLQD